MNEWVLSSIDEVTGKDGEMLSVGKMRRRGPSQMGSRNNHVASCMCARLGSSWELN